MFQYPNKSQWVNNQRTPQSYKKYRKKQANSGTTKNTTQTKTKLVTLLKKCNTPNSLKNTHETLIQDL